MLWVKFCLNKSNGSDGGDFLYFVIISPWRYVALHLNQFEFPLPKNALCQVWLKLAKQFWRQRFLHFFNVFSLFLNYLPLRKDVVLHLNKVESPSPKQALRIVWLKLAQWFWIRWKCEKFTDRRQAIKKSHLSSLLWEQFNVKNFRSAMNKQIWNWVDSLNTGFLQFTRFFD